MNNPAKQQAPLFNGIDTEALAQARAGVEADPASGVVTFRATTAWQGGLCSRSRIASYDVAGQRIARTHEIVSDEPLELLGGDTAPNPQDLILSALAACMTVGFVAGATALGVRLDALEIDTECTLDLRGALGVDPNVAPGARKILYTVRVKGAGTPQQFDEILRNVMATSPNYYHLANPIALESKLVVL